MLSAEIEDRGHLGSDGREGDVREARILDQMGNLPFVFVRDGVLGVFLFVLN